MRHQVDAEGLAVGFAVAADAVAQIDDARGQRLGGIGNGQRLAVAESGIRTRADIDRLMAAGYGAFLVGERLIASPDPGAALRELRGR